MPLVTAIKDSSVDGLETEWDKTQYFLQFSA